MSRASALSPAAILTAMLLLSAPAWADDADRVAAAAFEEGARAFASGDFVRAADAFDRAYASRPHHDALWNAARAHHRAGDDVRAANLYARYLREAPPDARDRDTATASLATLGSSLGRIDIHAPEGMTRVMLDGSATDARQVWVSPGEHLVEGTAASGVVKRRLRADAGQRVSVTLEPDPPRLFAPSGSATTRRPFPWPILVVGAGLTAVLGGVTTWSALDTVEQKKAFDAERSAANLDEGRARQTRTNVLLGVTAGVAVITASAIGVILLTPRPRAREGRAATTRVALELGPGSALLSGSF